MLGLADDENVPKSTDFPLGIICALAKEVDAVEAIFDYIWETEHILKEKDNKRNELYTLGRIGDHLAALVWIRGIGKTSACSAAEGLKSQFPEVKHVLVVGICGGVPFNKNPNTSEPFEILLGDVIISTAIHKYDEGKILERGRDYVAGPQVEPQDGGVFDELLSSIRSRRKYRERKETSLAKDTATHLREIFTEDKYKDMQHPGYVRDRLFNSSHIHKHWDEEKCIQCREAVCAAVDNMTCESLGCKTEEVARRKRIDQMKGNTNPGPSVWFGPIGSADKVVKSGEYRDKLSSREKIIGIEMEGAGVCGVFKDFVVIKSVCDYADSHKNKIWQPYAAAVAAACTKALLELLGSKIPKRDHKLKLPHGSKSQSATEIRKSLASPRKDPEEVEELTRIYEERGTIESESLGLSAAALPARADAERGSTKSETATTGMEQQAMDSAAPPSLRSNSSSNSKTSFRHTQQDFGPDLYSDKIPTHPTPQYNPNLDLPNPLVQEHHQHLYQQQYLPNQYPLNQYPPNQHSPNQYSPNQHPPNQYSPNQYPPSQYPPNQYPPNHYPPNQYPPNQYQGPFPPRPLYPQLPYHQQSHPPQNWGHQPPNHQSSNHEPPHHQTQYQPPFSNSPYQNFQYQSPSNNYQVHPGVEYFDQQYSHSHSEQLDQNQSPFYAQTPSQPTSPDPANSPLRQQSYPGSSPRSLRNAQQMYSPVQNPFRPTELPTPLTSPPASKASIDTKATSEANNSSVQTHALGVLPISTPEPTLSEPVRQEATPKESKHVVALETHTQGLEKTDSLVQGTMESAGLSSETNTLASGKPHTAFPPSPAPQLSANGTANSIVTASETHTTAPETPESAPVSSQAQQSLKVDEETEDPQQTQALISACDAQDLVKVQAILMAPSKVDITATNKRGKTMLQLAIGTARLTKSKVSDVGKIVRALCEAGAEVDKKDKYGMAPLHLCGKYMSLDAAMALLDHEADPNLKDKNGRTAMYHIAVDNNPNVDFVRRLIERGGTLAGKTLPDLQNRALDTQFEVRQIISEMRL